MPTFAWLAAPAATTPRFPDVARLIAKLTPGTLILDGEVAVFDERLVSRFDLLGESVAPSVYTA